MNDLIKNSRYILLFVVIALVFTLCICLSLAKNDEGKVHIPEITTTHSTTTTTTTTTTIPKEPDPLPPTPLPPNGITVCVDAGHGWADNGASSFVTDSDGFPICFEKDINLEIAKHLRDRLEFLGYTVIMIRESDDIISPAGIASDNICNIERRVSWVNTQSDIDLMISVHCDSFTNTAVNGTRIYYNTDKHGETAILGPLLSEALMNGSVASRAPLLYEDSNKLWSLRQTKMPSILVECGFLTGDTDIINLTDSAYQKSFGIALADGINEYFDELKNS